MALYSTAYPNNSRTIVGTAVLFQDDSILLCDTSLGAVNITLLDIPNDYWNTTWKLYVVDKSNNAGTNNITINAGIGQTINSGASLVINTNGGSAVIRIASNSSYLGNLTGSAVGTGYTTIQDEGIALPQRNTLDFVGSGVVAYDNGFKTIVSINGVSVIPIVNADLNTLKTTNNVVVGQFYLVVDAVDSTLTVATSNGTGVIVQGTNTSSVTGYGSGVFLNADYQGVGNYSGVAGYLGTNGIWTLSTSPNAGFGVGKVNIYNNVHYQNKTGAWGTAPDTDGVNWLALSSLLTNGYIQEVDFVLYDVTTNTITYRADNRQNEVNNGLNSAISKFQWGRLEVSGNKVLSDAYMDCTNSNCTFTDNNIFGSNSRIVDNTPYIVGFIGSFISNSIFGSAYIQTGINQRDVFKNRLIGSETYISIGIISGASRVTENDLSGASKITIATLSNGSLVSKVTMRNDSEITCTLVDDNSGFSDITLETSQIIVPNLLNFGKVKNCSFAQSSITSNVGAQKIDGANIEYSSFFVATIFFTSLTKNISNCDIQHTFTSIDFGTPTADIQYRKYGIGYSNFQATIDGATQISLGGLLTIPTGLEYVGEFIISNGLGKVISSIGGAVQTNHDFLLIPDNQAFTITPVAVGVAFPNDVVANSYTTGAGLYTPRINATDYAVLKQNAINFTVGLIQKNIWV